MSQSSSPSPRPGSSAIDDFWGAPRSGGSGDYQPSSALIGMRGCLLILGIGALLFLGVIIASYVALSRFASPPPTVALTPAQRSFDADLGRFNHYLAQWRQKHPADATAAVLAAGASDETADDVRRQASPAEHEEIEIWFRQATEKYQQTFDRVPVSVSMFLEACRVSPLATNDSLMNRLVARATAEAVFPDPDLESHQTIIGIDVDSTGNLATVHFLDYDGEIGSDYTSLQWFLVKEEGDWKLYDWLVLEYGRRISDEYGGYHSALQNPLQDGYDEFSSELNEVRSGFYDRYELTEYLRHRLRALENKPMLPHDRLLSHLRLAWAWQEFGEVDEALRLLDGIQHPDMQFGVLQTRMILENRRRGHESAINRFAALSPDHPMVHKARGHLLSAREEWDDATNQFLTALLFWPYHDELFGTTLDTARPHQVSHLVNYVFRRNDSTQRLMQMVTWWGYRPDMLASLAASLAPLTGDPAAVGALATAIRGNLLGDREAAAAQLSRVKGQTSHPELSNGIAIELLDLRLALGQFDLWLSEADDQAVAMAALAERILDDPTTVDLQSLLSTVNQRSLPPAATPIVELLQAWLHREQATDEAITVFSRFIDDADSIEAALGLEDEAEDAEVFADYSDVFSFSGLLVSVNRDLDSMLLMTRQFDRFYERMTAPQRDRQQSLTMPLSQLQAGLINLHQPQLLEQFAERIENDRLEDAALWAAQLRAVALHQRGDDQAAVQQWQMALATVAGSADARTAERFGHWLVRQRLPLTAELDDHPKVIAAVRAAALPWLDEAMFDELEERYPSHLATIDDYRSRFVLDDWDRWGTMQADRDGYLDDAEDFLFRRVNRADSNNPWSRHHAIRDLAQWLCRHNRTAEARLMLTQHQRSQEQFEWAMADLLLAEQKWEALEAMFTKPHIGSAGQWLLEPFARAQLADHPDRDEHFMRSLTLSYGENYRDPRLTLMLSDRPEFTAEDVIAAFRAAGEANVAVELVQGAADQVAWLVTQSGSSQRVLVTLHPRTAAIDDFALTAEAEAAVAECRWVLQFLPLDDIPGSLRDAWRVMQSMLAIDNVSPRACRCFTGGFFAAVYWFDNDSDALIKRLQWDGRVPIDGRAMIGVSLQWRTLDGQPLRQAWESGTTAAAQHHHWSQRLQEAGEDGTVEAVLEIRVGGFTEPIACEVVQVQDDSATVAVRLKQASKIIPWMTPQRVLRTEASHVVSP